MTDLGDVREILKKKYDKIMWLKNNLEFDYTKKQNFRLKRFIKRKLLFDPINDEDLKKIPPLYRFRFYGIFNPHIDFYLIDYRDRVMNLKKIGIHNDPKTKELYDSQFLEIKAEFIERILLSSESIKLPFVIDIRKINPDDILNDTVHVNNSYEHVLIFDATVERLRRLRTVIRNEEKIKQMLEASKVICKAYQLTTIS